MRTILNCTSRFVWVFAGRRWRKTTLFMIRAILGALKGETIIWGAPVLEQARIGFDEIRKATRGVFSVRYQNPQIIAPGGRGRILFLSLDDPDNAKGKTANGIILDEAPLLRREAWYEALRPTISDTGGWLLAGGTPKGRNWAWKESVEASMRVDASVFQIPTKGAKIVDGELIRTPHPLENPDFPWEEMLSLFRTMPERTFRQEILAEFIEEGSFFRGVAAVADAERQPFPRDSHRYVFGVDWGKHEDWTWITVIDASLKTVCHLERFNRIDYTFQLKKLEGLAAVFNPDLIVVESNSAGGPLIENLVERGLPVEAFNTTAASKKEALEALSLAIERGDLHLVDDETLIEELEAFEVKRTQAGTFRYEAPAGMHDDGVIATMLAWHGCNSGTGGVNPADLFTPADVRGVPAGRESDSDEGYEAPEEESWDSTF